MRKIANNQQARDHPLKWDYFCDDCESTHKVQRDDYTEFMKRMGENKDNHDY